VLPGAFPNLLANGAAIEALSLQFRLTAREAGQVVDVLARLAGLSTDPAFVGYPYPLARAHQAGIVTLIDEALKRFAGRDLVSSNEVLDLLLDMRTAAVSDAAIAALIDAEVDHELIEGAHADSPRPDLILLDLNLPKMDGREVLAQIKADKGLKTIPTVILTTSNSEVDVLKSYQLRANCYLSKPVELVAFENLVKSINDFWLTKAALPQHERSTENPDET